MFVCFYDRVVKERLIVIRCATSLATSRSQSHSLGFKSRYSVTVLNYLNVRNKHIIDQSDHFYGVY